MKTSWITFAMLSALGIAWGAEKTPAFRAQVIDPKVEIGYGLAIADVQGDGKPDIILVDKHTISWYENPTWTKHVIAENLTKNDNVCIAARDIDGDGKCEIAVGAEWNPGDTENSGAVFYLIPPADRTQKWEPVKLPNEPTVHRMKWVKRGNGSFDLVVLPLHGRGNKNGEGAGVKMLAYHKPANPKDEWKTEVISDDLHMSHNFDVVKLPNQPDVEHLLIGGKEGMKADTNEGSAWKSTLIYDHRTANPPLKGIGEIRFGVADAAKHKSIIATIEPMHGTEVACYLESENPKPGGGPPVDRFVLDNTLDDGHALAIADLLDLGRPQIVAGWRADKNKLAKVGIKMFIPKDTTYKEWETVLIDDNTMACEDLVLADLNGDGKLDIIASGRRTHNLTVYWNETK